MNRDNEIRLFPTSFGQIPQVGGRPKPPPRNTGAIACYRFRVTDARRTPCISGSGSGSPISYAAVLECCISNQADCGERIPLAAMNYQDAAK